MTSLQKQARLWREAFEVKSDNERGSLQYNLQIKLIIEEYTEVIEAYYAFKQSDLSTHVALLKELADLVFVCYQAAENMGWDLDETMRRVLDSNLSPNYKPPVLDDLVA